MKVFNSLLSSRLFAFLVLFACESIVLAHDDGIIGTRNEIVKVENGKAIPGDLELLLDKYKQAHYQSHGIEVSADTPRPMLFLFGFTACSKICPSVMAYVSSALNALLDEGAFDFYFVSVDEQGDSEKTLQAFTALFHKRIIPVPHLGAQAAKMYEYFQTNVISLDRAGNRDFQHSMSLYILDQDRVLRFEARIPFQRKEVRETLRSLIPKQSAVKSDP